MATYSIKAIKYCEQTVPGAQMFYMAHFDKDMRADFYFWLLRRDDGKVALVDCGVRDVDEFNTVVGGPSSKYAFRMNMQTHNIPLLLRREGVALEDVEWLFLTHLHYDHASNVHLFPNARIVVNRRGWIATLAPKYPHMVPHPLFPHDSLAHLVHQANDRLILAAESDGEIAPGISVFYVGGHTQCCQAIKVNTKQGVAIFPSDTIFYYANLEQNHPIGLNLNLIECYDCMARVRREADIVIPAHDPRVLEKFPDGVVVP
jgi:glyoxylase-like metal-dependent hydrolase (beta-lactamase superfamily II)